MSETLHTLVAARALIANPAKWIRGIDRANIDCFCAAGAIRHVPIDIFVQIKAIKAVCVAAGIPSQGELGELHSAHLRMWNDTQTTTHPMVIAAFDKAIEGLRSRSGA